MARTKTTTPTNKNDTAAKTKPSKAKKSKTTVLDTDGESVPSEEKKPATTTIGEALLAKGKPPVKEVQVQNFTRRLPCQLTTPELIEKSRRAADIRRCCREEKKVVESAKLTYDGVKKDSEARVSEWERELERLDDAINANLEHRDVPCQRVYDYSHGSGEYRELRLDTTPPQLLQAPRPMTVKEIEDGYTGERKSPEPMQAQSTSGDDAIVDDDYTGEDDEDASDDDMEIDFS